MKTWITVLISYYGEEMYQIGLTLDELMFSHLSYIYLLYKDAVKNLELGGVI